MGSTAHRTLVTLAVLALPSIAGCPAPQAPSCRATDTCDAGAIDAAMGHDAAYPDTSLDANLDNTCASVRLETMRVTPNVIVVIDRSGSMNLIFDAGVSRWDVLYNSLFSPSDGLVHDLESAVRFGMVMYSEDPDFGGCPDVSTFAARLDAFTAMSAQYDANSPGGNTPTGQSMEAVLGAIDTLAPVRTDPTVIVLATDGEPATCEDGTDVTTGRMLSVDAAAHGFAMGIQTFVVSVGTEPSMAHLQDVANAGVGHAASDPDAPFWVATDATGLHDALWEIVSGIRSCEVELVGAIDPALACEGTVTLGTEDLACGTDWMATDTTHIELLADACDRFRRSTATLYGTFPCDVLVF